MRTDLAEDPATIMVAAKTGLDEFAVVGRLHRLWSWADSQTSDGRIVGVTGEWIDRYLQAPGFAAALAAARWILITKQGVRFPNFDRHNGQSGKARAANTRRQQVLRSGRAPSATQARPKRDARPRGRRASSATEARPEKRRGEKKRGEKSTARTTTARTKAQARTVPDAVPTDCASAGRACRANGEQAARLLRAVAKVNDERESGVSAARRSEVIAAVSVINHHADPLAKVTEVIERSRKRHVNPLRRGGYVAEALIKAADELEVKATAAARAPP